MVALFLDDHGCSEPFSRGLAFLKQDVGHAAKIREHLTYQAKLEGLLQLAGKALLNGDKNERRTIAKQIEDLLAQHGNAA